MNITVADNNTDATATIDADDFAATVSPWFTGAPAEVTDAITEIADILTRTGQQTAEVDGLATFLDITIDPA